MLKKHVIGNVVKHLFEACRLFTPILPARADL